MRPSLAWIACVMMSALFGAAAQAERQPVLRQVDVPHSYYWREMYIPQLTSGPSALAWSPDGAALVYAMQGSLWRQAIGSTTAVQLTAGPGYDYQPDWSPDGRTIIFSRYFKDAIELWTLDVASGKTRALTQNGGVNLEARWSPAGDRIAFVSTFATGRFRLFTAAMQGAFAPVQFSPERRSAMPRYYYSPFDHELSPSWSPDGKQLLYVSNPETGYGTGSLWRRGVAGGDPVLVREEETSWRARPDWARDGKRVIWASYAGRQWHQLWLTGSAGKSAPLPLTYGEFDIAAPRWSPDGRRIAFVSNETGDGAIRIIAMPGGAATTVAIAERRYLAPMGRLALEIRDATGKPVAGRVSITGSDGRSYAPDAAWRHADDNYDRADFKQERHYFHSAGDGETVLPAGKAIVTVWRGLEQAVVTRTVDIRPDATASLTVVPPPIAPPGLRGWVSGDTHVHMNYGGTYRNTPARMVAQAEAEDLDIVWNLVVNKEQRIPDIAEFATVPDPASTTSVLLVPAQEYHTSLWGHLGLIGLTDHLLLPDYAAYPNSGAFSLYPDNAAVADLAHAQGALVGYVHPFDPGPEPNSTSAYLLPVDAALGKIDYYEVVSFSDHKTSAAIWYRLLNLGFRLPAAGGTDAMANYASLRGPVGLDRTYVLPANSSTGSGDGGLSARRDAWLAGLKAGRSMATNGPLLTLDVEGQGPGAEIAYGPGRHRLAWRAEMRAIAAVDHVELIWNGKVVARITPDRTGRSASASGAIEIDGSGWLLLRAWSDHDAAEILDLYPYGTTSPVYVTVAGAPHRAPGDAQYMLDWLDLIEKTAASSDQYNVADEKRIVLDTIAQARKIYESMR